MELINTLSGKNMNSRIKITKCVLVVVIKMENATEIVFEDGCEQAVLDKARSNLYIIGVVAAAIAVPQVSDLTALCLGKAERRCCCYGNEWYARVCTQLVSLMASNVIVGDLEDIRRKQQDNVLPTTMTLTPGGSSGISEKSYNTNHTVQDSNTDLVQQRTQ
jgi:hypothetical protein